jgi:hypothetical protein
MRSLQQAIRLAAQVGQGLGAGEILLGPMQGDREGIVCMSAPV